MRKTNGRRVALLLTILTLVLASAFVAVFHQDIYEFWLQRRLESSDRDVRVRAAEELAGLGSLRGVKRVVDLIVSDEEEQIALSYRNGLVRQVYLTPLYDVLFRLGPEVESHVTRRLRELDHGARDRLSPNLDYLKSFWRADPPPSVQRVEYGFEPPPLPLLRRL